MSKLNKKVLIGIGVILLICCVVCALVAFAATTALRNNVNATEFNNNIVKEQIEISKDIKSLNNLINSEDSSLDAITEARLDLITNLEDSTKYIESLDVPNHGQEFRDVSVELFDFYTRIMKDEYVESIDILYSDDYSSEGYAKILEIDAKIKQEEADLKDKLDDAQKDFAEKANFSIVDSE